MEARYDYNKSYDEGLEIAKSIGVKDDLAPYYADAIRKSIYESQENSQPRERHFKEIKDIAKEFKSLSEVESAMSKQLKKAGYDVPYLHRDLTRGHNNGHLFVSPGHIVAFLGQGTEERITVSYHTTFGWEVEKTRYK